jgi:hypothetical protein
MTIIPGGGDCRLQATDRSRPLSRDGVVIQGTVLTPVDKFPEKGCSVFGFRPDPVRHPKSVGVEVFIFVHTPGETILPPAIQPGAQLEVTGTILIKKTWSDEAEGSHHGFAIESDTWRLLPSPEDSASVLQPSPEGIAAASEEPTSTMTGTQAGAQAAEATVEPGGPAPKNQLTLFRC